MALHDDPKRFYTTEMLATRSDEELDEIAQDALGVRDDPDRPDEERDRWAEVLVRIDEVRAAREV
ncbi:MAG: hypothetical protein WB239_04450 [Acidimicrobiia bacterium]